MAKGKELSTLPVELRLQFGFREDESGNWLQSDNFPYTHIGGAEAGEWLPTRSRVSLDGKQLQIGAHVHDLEGYLGLMRTIEPKVADIDWLMGFWKGSKRIRQVIEDQKIFLGVGIDGSCQGMESNISSLGYAYELALLGTRLGLSRAELRKKSDILKYRFGQVEHPHGSLYIFDVESVEEMFRTPEVSRMERQEFRLSDSLAEFPIKDKGSLRQMTGYIRVGRQQQDMDDIFLAIVRESGTFHISASSEGKHWEMKLLGDGRELEVMGDFAKSGSVLIEKDDKEEEVKVDIAIGSDSMVLKSSDGNFEMVINKATCADCPTPLWNFPWPEPGQVPEREKMVFSMHQTTMSDVYIKTAQVEGKDINRCLNCAQRAEKEFLSNHPFASIPRAREIARRRLDEMGYEVLNIPRNGLMGGDSEYRMMTERRYQRSGREVIRYTGDVIVDYDGGFKSKLLPREYIQYGLEG